MLGSAAPPHLRPPPALGSVAPPACTPNHARVPRPCPRMRPAVPWLRGAVPSLARPCLFSRVIRLHGHPVQLQGAAPSNSGLRSCLQAFRSCSPTASPVGLAFRWLLVAPAPSDLASVGFGLACLVPDLARLNSSPAPAHFLASFRSSNSAPGFSVLVATQIRPNPPIPMRHNVTLSR